MNTILSRRALLILVLIGCALSPIFVFRLTFKDFGLTAGRQIPASSILPIKNVIALPKPEQSKYGLPVRLRIPKIGVDSVLEYVGTTTDGAMAVPKGPGNAAWFDLGPRPGDKGSAVIAGHYGWKDNIPAVFDDLSKLEKGDRIYVQDAKGTVTAFVVRESRMYGENDDALSVFSSDDGKAHLNLITCEGVWNSLFQSYSERLVVFADKEYE